MDIIWKCSSFCYCNFSNIHHTHAYRLICYRGAMIKLAMWQIHPRHCFLRTLSSWPCVWQRMWKADAVPAAWCISMHFPNLGEELYEGITEHLGVPADDVDFVSRCSGTTTAKTWLPDFVLPADEVCRMAPVRRRRCAQGKKGLSSVGLNRCVHRGGIVGTHIYIYIPWITPTVAGSCRFRRIFCQANMFQQWSKRSWMESRRFGSTMGDSGETGQLHFKAT